MAVSRRQPTIQRLRDRGAFRRHPAGLRAQLDWTPPRRSRGHPRSHQLQVRRVGLASGAAPSSRGVSVRPARHGSRGRRQGRPRRGLRAAGHVPRRIEREANGGAVREQRVWARGRLRARIEERESRSRAGSRRAGSRRVSVPRHLLTAPEGDGGPARLADGGELRESVDAGHPPAGGRSRPGPSSARDAGVDRREGDRESHRAPTRRGGLCQPSENGDGIAVRSNRHLCTRTGGPLQRQPHPRRPAVQLALQHVSLCRPAARTDRIARPRLSGCRRRAG